MNNNEHNNGMQNQDNLYETNQNELDLHDNVENHMGNEARMEKPSLFGMIGSPRKQFERIRENPTILVALIVVTILAIISTLFTLQGMDVQLEEDLAGLGEGEMLLFTIITQVTAVIVATIAPSIVILIGAAIYLLIAKIAKTDVSFKQLFSMLAFIAFITSLGALLNGLVSFFIGGGYNPEVPVTSLNVIVGADGILGLILSSIEVFSIWGIILTAIGLQVVAKFSKGLAWGIVIAFNLIALAFGVMAVVIDQSLSTMI